MGLEMIKMAVLREISKPLSLKETGRLLGWLLNSALGNWEFQLI